MKKILFLFLLIPFVISCDKEKEVQVSPIDLLTDGKAKFWKFESWIINDNDIVNDPASNGCYKNHTIIFQKTKGNYDNDGFNTEYIWQYNGTPCDGGTDKEWKLVFFITSDKKSLVLGGVNYDILELTGEKLILQTIDEFTVQKITYIPVPIPKKDQD